jgi:hypothetical protein
VAREEKDEARVEKLLRLAYKANPDNPDVLREARLIDARRKNKAEDRADSKK